MLHDLIDFTNAHCQFQLMPLNAWITQPKMSTMVHVRKILSVQYYMYIDTRKKINLSFSFDRYGYYYVW